MDQRKENRFPFTPYPDGIFAVAFTHEVQAKRVIPITFMGEKLALFRTEKGEIGAIDSFCPHLGANLAHGCVKQDSLQCPFHGIRFNRDGCSLMKDRQGVVGNFKVKSWAAFEKYGMIFLSHQSQKPPLHIQLPEWNLTEWGNPIAYCFKIKSHPQEILENSVDQLHFFQVHQYLTVKAIDPLCVKSTEFTICYQLERREGLFGFLDRNKIQLKLTIHAYGLGLSKVEVLLPKYHINVKQIVFPTPIDGEYIHVRTLTSVKIPDKFPFIPRIFTPLLLRKRIANWLSSIAAKGFLKDFFPDLRIWENKKYVAQPHYLSKDGEFEAFRKWAAQFYRDDVGLHELKYDDNLVVQSTVAPRGTQHRKE